MNIINRVGTIVRPNASYSLRPDCQVIESKPAELMGSKQTLHVVEYPNKTGIYVWESEWPGRFDEVTQAN